MAIEYGGLQSAPSPVGQRIVVSLLTRVSYEQAAVDEDEDKFAVAFGMAFREISFMRRVEPC